jgi:hypothetical protein
VAWTDEKWYLATGDKRQVFPPYLCDDLVAIIFSSLVFRLPNLEKPLNTLPLIVHWLAWKPGSGDSIIVGKDELLGLGKDSILSVDLISCLNNKNVYFLYQASRVSP